MKSFLQFSEDFRTSQNKIRAEREKNYNAKAQAHKDKLAQQQTDKENREIIKKDIKRELGIE